MEKISVNSRRGKLVFRRLLKALRANQYPYNIIKLPQDQIPEELRRDPLRCAQFFFYACYFMRGAQKSEIAVRQLVVLWRHAPEIFHPEVVATYENEQKLKELLALAINYHLDEIAGFWLRGSKSLMSRWQGDPRLIFKAARDGDSARRLMTNKKVKGEKPVDLFDHDWGFEGSQGKITSMLAYYLLAAKLINRLDIAPANDFHIGRVTLGTEVLVPTDELHKHGIRYDQIYKKGEQLMEEFCKSGESSTKELGDALWWLSASLCRIAPGNASVGRSKKRGRRDANGKKVLPKQLKVDPHNTNHLDRYERSCHRCPVESLCKWNAPSGAYYEGGAFMLYPRIRLQPRDTLFQDLRDHVVPRRFRAGALNHKEEAVQLAFFEEDETGE